MNIDNEAVLVELRANPGSTLDQLASKFGGDHERTKEFLAMILGYLVANNKVSVSRWTGTNAVGKNAHQYSAV